MSELMFILKCLVLTAALTILMQVKVGPSSLEQQAHWYLQKSSVSIYIQSVASGGALAAQNLYVMATRKFRAVTDSYNQQNSTRAEK